MGEADSGELLYFTRPDARFPDRLWVRFEYKASHHAAEGYRSTRALIQSDCETGRLRSLQTTSFKQPNLAGESVSSETPEPWFYPGPNTVHEVSFNSLCTTPR